MIRKEGTQRMLKAMLLFMRKRHPSIKEVVFSDNSQIPCHGYGGAVDLAARNLLIKGQTWYMEIGAVPQDELLGKVYEKAKRRIGRLVNMSFDEFSKTRGLSSSERIEDIRRLYNACHQKQSWKELFRQLYDLDCRLFFTGAKPIRTWLAIFGFPEPQIERWIFPLEVIESWGTMYHVKTERSLVTGGGLDKGEWSKPHVYDQHLIDD